MDRGILKLIQEHTFSGADFMLQRDGVVRLNPEVVGVVVSQMGIFISVIRIGTPWLWPSTS